MFYYIQFCNQWYAVNLQSYNFSLLITAENCYLQEAAFQIPTIFSIIELKSVSIHTVNAGKAWHDGIYYDLSSIDPDIEVVSSFGQKIKNIASVKNSIAILGMRHFANDICIRTDDYVNAVFSHYYNPLSMEYEMTSIKDLRKKGYEYYNPFTQNLCVNTKDKNKQQKIREKGIDFGETIAPRNIDCHGIPIMESRDVYSNLFKTGKYPYWR